MKNDEIFIDWIELTASLIQKYNLDSLSAKVEGQFLLNKEYVSRYKELVKITVKDENKYIIKNEYYDILETDKEVE